MSDVMPIIEFLKKQFFYASDPLDRSLAEPFEEKAHETIESVQHFLKGEYLGMVVPEKHREYCLALLSLCSSIAKAIEDAPFEPNKVSESEFQAHLRAWKEYLSRLTAQVKDHKTSN